MKKAFFLVVLAILGTTSYSQKTLNGNLIGIHVGTVDLEPSITINQWKEFAMEKYIPAVNKEFKGEIITYLAEGERGPFKNYVAFYMVFKSVEIRDKYIPEQGQTSEEYDKKWQIIKPVYDDLQKLGKFSRDHWTDWVIL